MVSHSSAGFLFDMTRSLWVVVFGVCIIIVLAAVVSSFTPTSSQESPFDRELFPSFQDEKKRWVAYGREHTAQEIYQAFLEKGNTLPYGDAHTLAHIVAEVLFEKEGDSAIRFCTSDFGFGCYHGVAGAALLESGLKAVGTLAKSCRSEGVNYLGCSHGIGHGVLAHLGDDNLEQALYECLPVQGVEPVGGCFGGVFMEYYFHTMQSTEGIAVRQYDKDRFDEPCRSLAREFQTACYYELPSWWRAHLDIDATEELKETPMNAFRVVGERCALLKETDRETCFRGVGNVIGPTSGYDPEVMESWCSIMPSAGAAYTCYQEALGHMLQSGEGKMKSRAL